MNIGQQEIKFQIDQNGQQVMSKFMEFLGNFKVRKEEGSDEFIDIYGDQAHTMVQNERQTMFINLKHVKEFDG